MPRKKAKDQQQVLTHPIIIRVTKTVFDRLEKKRQESDCGTIGEVARKMLSNKAIKCFYKDVTLNPVMEELAQIRKELFSEQLCSSYTVLFVNDRLIKYAQSVSSNEKFKLMVQILFT